MERIVQVSTDNGRNWVNHSAAAVEQFRPTIPGKGSYLGRLHVSGMDPVPDDGVVCLCRIRTATGEFIPSIHPIRAVVRHEVYKRKEIVVLDAMSQEQL